MNKLITGRTYYYAPAANIVMSVTITGSPTEEEIEAAVQKAVNKHDIFSHKVILDQKGDCYYMAAAPRNVTLEVRERMDPDSFHQLVREQERIPFHFTEGELIKFFMLKNIEETKLVIIASHLVGDSSAIVFLTQDILTALNNPEVIFEKHPIMLLEDYGLPSNSKLKSYIGSRLRKLNRRWNKKRKIFSYQEFLNMFHSYWNNREHEINNDTLGGAELKNLLRKCKDNHISINSAIAAAFLLASGDEKMGLQVSVRPEEYEGMGNYESSLTIRCKTKNTMAFFQTAQRIHRMLHTRMRKNSEKYFVLQFLRGLEPTLLDAAYFYSFAGYKNRTASSVSKLFGYVGRRNPAMSLTNLTKLPVTMNYGRYSIEQLEFLPPLQPNHKAAIGVVTVDDLMTVTMQFEQNKDADTQRKVFEAALDILKYGL